MARFTTPGQTARRSRAFLRSSYRPTASVSRLTAGRSITPKRFRRLWSLPFNRSRKGRKVEGLRPDFVNAYPGLAYFDSLACWRMAAYAWRRFCGGHYDFLARHEKNASHRNRRSAGHEYLAGAAKSMKTAYVTASGTGKASRDRLAAARPSARIQCVIVSVAIPSQCAERGASALERCGTFSASERNAFASALCGACATIGTPASDVSRIAGTRGISPRKAAPSSSATLRAPPSPKM